MLLEKPEYLLSKMATLNRYYRETNTEENFDMLPEEILMFGSLLSKIVAGDQTAAIWQSASRRCCYIKLFLKNFILLVAFRDGLQVYK